MGLALTEGLDGMATKIVIYDKRETVLQSMATDGITFAFLLLCIWFSWHMGGGVWTFITVCMLLLWCSAKLPWEGSNRKTIVKSKAEAQAWAASLPEDAV